MNIKVFNIAVKGKILVFFILFFTAVISRIFGGEKDLAVQMVRKFFTLVYQRQYKAAYNCFSSSVKKEVSFSRFREGAQDVKYLRIEDVRVIDREENLIKMKISALVHLVYEGNLYEAVYEGKVDVYREKDRWTVMTVDLSAKSQKSLGKKAGKADLQKLDFGTK